MGLVLGALMVAAGCSSVAGASSSPSATTTSATTTVAVFETFSGPDAAYGQELYDACLAAVNVVNAAGGVLGRKLTCKAVDSTSDPNDAVTAVRRLLATTSNLGLVIGCDTAVAPTVYPILEQAKVPCVTPTSSDLFDKTTNPYFWRLLPPDNDLAAARAIAAYKNGVRRIASIFGNSPGEQGGAKPFASAFVKVGGKINLSLALTDDQPSYGTEAARVASTNPQALSFEADPQTSATFLKSLQLLGKLPPIYGGVVTVPWINAVAGAIGGGTLASDLYILEAYTPFRGPAYKVFKPALLALKLPNVRSYTSDPFAAEPYDGVLLAAIAMIAAHSTNPSVYNSYITKVTSGSVVVQTFAQAKAALANGKKVRYEGVLGPIAFNRYHTSSGAMALVQFPTANAMIQGTAPNIIRIVPASAIAKITS